MEIGNKALKRIRQKARNQFRKKRKVCGRHTRKKQLSQAMGGKRTKRNWEGKREYPDLCKKNH